MPEKITTPLTGFVKYRGLGHFTFLMHRLAGLATIAFLTLHILTTATVFFVPQWYTFLVQVFRNPFFVIGEIIILYFVLFHGVNGLRIAYADLFRPDLWKKEPTRKAMRLVFWVSFVLWLPVLGIMGYHLLRFGFGMFGGE
jgi:succinate dehydrogenase / fumarate reductase, cytochrome b subunit